MEFTFKNTELFVFREHGLENVDLTRCYYFKSFRFDQDWLNYAVNDVSHPSSLLKLPFGFEHLKDWFVTIIYEKVAIVFFKVFLDNI